MNSLERRARQAGFVALAAASVLSAAGTASGQLGAAGPYGAAGNYGYYGGTGPYGWGPYAFGWGGFTTAGTGPAMPPAGELPDLRVPVAGAARLSPATAGDLLRRQAEASSYRDRRRAALRGQMHTRYDLSTGRPRSAPARMPADPAPLDRRLATLFQDDGTIAWPSGLGADAPAARRAVEQVARVALEQYRLNGRANLTDVADARHRLADFAAPVLARLTATDDPLASQAGLDFFQRLDTALIDLADPPTTAPGGPEPAPAAGGGANAPG